MIIPSSGGDPVQLTFANGQSWPNSFSPDGDKIAFAGFRNGTWNVWWFSRSTKEEKQDHTVQEAQYVRTLYVVVTAR